MSLEKKILIVDDDRQFTKIISDWFGPRGFEVLVAHNGPDALKTFREQDVDAVILDVLIPKIDGFKTCKQMREIPGKRSIPIIMVSAIYKKPSEAIRAKNECGATAYMNKPLDLMEVYGTVLQTMPKK